MAYEPVLLIRIRSDLYPTLMNTTKLTGKENLTTYACCLAPCGPTDKANQVQMYKKNRFKYITYSLKQ